jgi:hypothetical protein
MTGRGRNVGASVRARLLNLSRERGEQLDYVLNRYATERLLHRLSCSALRDDFVLKGATLLRAWSAGEYRPTRDVDFLRFGSPDLEDVARCIRDLCAVGVPDDGIVFNASSVAISKFIVPVFDANHGSSAAVVWRAGGPWVASVPSDSDAR